MDPDIPIPSVEQHDQPASKSSTFANYRDKAGTPVASSSPNRTPYKTPLSHPASPAPTKSTRSPSVTRNERHSSPNLLPKRSSSSLSINRGQTPARIQLRRVSSNLNPSSPAVNMKQIDLPQPPPVLTPGSVAKEYFEREIEVHSNARSETMVIVHDSCYGHRFSRPRATKAALATIVERPERIHATLLGVSTAYVRLGGRHCEGEYGPHPRLDTKTASAPPFVIKKTTRNIELNHPAVTHIHGTKWMEELQILCDSAEAKLAINGKELQRPIGYGKDEQGNPLPKLHEGDLYLCAESLSALRGCLGGVCDAVDSVFASPETKRAFVCIRPPGHHCSSDYPSGFCWLNNVHVGISYAAMHHGLTHAAIIDFDLHHGDGSQTITWDHNQKAQSLPKNAASHKKTPIGYYSLHDINSYPCEWGDEEKVKNASLCLDNAHGQSIWNVHLESWKSLEHFWQLYESKYRALLGKAELFLKHHSDKLRTAGVQPKAAIFLSAGFDASQWEGQGMQRHSVNVPTEFYARFTADVVELAEKIGLGVDGRVISVLEGGYSDRALTSGVLGHLCGLTHSSAEPVSESASYGVGVDSNDLRNNHKSQFDPTWWNEANLQALESRVAGNAPPPPSRNDKAPGNYSSPTQASTMRMTEVARERKSLSSQLENRLYLESLEPDPPPPVDWVTASYELSRILIPDDRQTLSCRHDELNAEATKARRERQSLIGVAAPSEPRMQLRTRSRVSGVESENLRAASRSSNRRTTIAAVSELPDPTMSDPMPSKPRRRSSAASSILSSFQDMKLDDKDVSKKTQSNSSRQSSTAPVPTDLMQKKTRMGPPAKKTASRTNSPRKMKDESRDVSNGTSLSKSNAGRTGNAVTGRTTSTSRPSTMGNLDARDTVKESANGAKKVSIKLKMPTPEQHAANQKQAEEARQKKPRVTKKPPVPKATSVKIAPNTSRTELNKPEIVTEQPVRVSEPQNATFSHARSNPNSSEAATTSSSHETGDTPMTSNLNVDNSSVATSTQNMHAVRNAHPMEGVSISPRKMADLPVFTSQSPIPFGNGITAATKDEPQKTTKPPTSIWDIPETPKH